MQKVFNANMIALVEQEPKTLPLRRFLELFLSFRLVVTIRRYEFDLAEARYRGHILEGLLKALDMLDEVIATIRKSKSQDTAKTNLMDKFDFTEVQAQAILDMQLRRLAALERMKLQNEHKEIKEKIKEYNEILENQDRILEIVNSDLEGIKEKYGDERRTKVVKGKIDEISEEDMIASEDTLVTITHSGYIKRVPPNTYRSQNRGGKGVSGGETKEGDFIEHAFLCNTHDELLLFTNEGKVFNLRIFEIPELGRTAKGLPLVNLIQLGPDEIVTSVLTRDPKGAISKEENKEKVYKYFLMATENGTVKKTELKEFAKIRSNGLTAINLEEGDNLSWVRPTTGEDEVIVITKHGKSIRFKETDVRPMGRNTKGVKGISFKREDDCVIGMGIVESEKQRLLTLSEFGYGKMSLLEEYSTQKRGGTGIFTFRVTKKTGDVSSARLLTEKEEEIVVISEKSKVIRADLKAVPVQGRQTSGVKVMNINGGDKVATVAVL
jgi:DNA gyrase subunit A